MTTALIIAVFFPWCYCSGPSGRRDFRISHGMDRLHKTRGSTSAENIGLPVLKKPTLRVVNVLTQEQIPKVKKQIKEISMLINRHREIIHQLRNAALICAGRTGMTAGHVYYEKEYARTAQHDQCGHSSSDS